jgi:hypothetical protein
MDPATESSNVNSANDNPASKHFRWSSYKKATTDASGLPLLSKLANCWGSTGG